MGLIVKPANKRLLKTLGFAIRMPILEDPALISKLNHEDHEEHKE